MMAPFRFDYTRTPTDESSFTERSWKSRTNTLVEEDGANTTVGGGGMKEQGGKRSRFWDWWDKATKQDADGPMNWKPLSMTTPILAAVIVASFLMVAATELLAQKSQRQGGLALSPSLNEIPQYAIITSQYVPQVLAVLYSLVWSWIDLDVKRMQPWFEMAKEGGALARDSLLLDYPYTFVALVPIKAAQRRHWLVLLSGTAMVLVFWAITPLQSAQFGTGSVSHSETFDISNRSQLVPLTAQKDLLGPEILNGAYAIAWLDQPFPRFTTAEAAFLPFYVDENTESRPSSRKNWTAATTRLSTELDCWPAEVSTNEFLPTATYAFLNGQGCNATINIPTMANYSMFYVGYRDSPYSSYWLANPECPPTENSTHQLLATWSRTKGSVREDESLEFNITGVYCQPSYFKQEVLLTVDAETLKPFEETMQTLAPREILPESEFNSSAFEFLLSNGMSSELKTRDHPFTFVVEQHPKLADRNLTIPFSNMVGFALAGENRDTADYSDAELLHQSYNRAHQYLFSFAVSQLLLNSTDFANNTATTTSFMSGIIVSRPISAALEALVLLIAVFTGFIIWFCHNSFSNLPMNPSSIDRIVELFRNSPELLDSLSSVDSADEKSLYEAIKNHRVRFVWNKSRGVPEIIVESKSTTEKSKTMDVPKGYYEPVKPLALRIGSGVAFIVAVVGVMAGMAYLKWAEGAYNGLRRPSPNREVQQILENYIPTILATLIEPFWVLVNRLLCVLQPFKDLWKGRAGSDHSISTTYTSIPPQFVIWRAIKSRHFILPMVCGIVFLTNVLTVSLPALFKEAETIPRYPSIFQPITAPTFNNESAFGLMVHVTDNVITTSDYQDHTYSALANMSMGTPLPPWVSGEYFFQPWKISNSSKDDQADYYSLQTRGFGIKTNCTPVPQFTLPVKPKVSPPENPSPGKCGDHIAIAGTRIRDDTSEREKSRGAGAIEYVSTPTYGEIRQCDTTMTLGWGRTSNVSDVNGTVEASFAICRPIFQTGLFDVNVDLDGRILSYNSAGEIKTSLDYPEAESQIESLIATSNNIIQNGPGGWHSDKLSREWINHLVYLETGSRAILDPEEPVPVPEEVIPKVDIIYRKLFSLLIGLNHEYLFNKPTADESTEGTRITVETRLYVDQAAFITSMIMLGINIIVAAIFYLQGVVFVLPRMPTTLGSLIAYVAPSRLVEELNVKATGNHDRTFSFGRYIGRDGGTHIGIEMDPHVVPIDPASLGKKARNRFGVIRGRDSEKHLASEAWL